MEQVYETIGKAWKEAGLAGRQVFATLGWHAAEEAVRQHCDAAGWTGPLWGPGYEDTWANWLHILLHSIDEAEGHTPARAWR
jgi:hypothetical protein